MNITEAINATPSQGLSRSPVNSGQVVRRSASQTPDSSDSVAKPGNSPDEPDRPAIRAHPTVSTEDSLRRLPETIEWVRYRNRMKKAAPENSGAGSAQNAGPASKTRSPYDPPPIRQRDLDLIA